jgi:phosphate transport system protein
MTHLEQELKSLKTDTSEMMKLVQIQLKKARKSLHDFDKDILLDVKHSEKRIDAFELKLSMDCENALALFSPVAIDLRFILSVLKMVTSIERLGDYAKSIVSLIGKFQHPVEQELFQQTQIMAMFEKCELMLDIIETSFETENATLARKTFLLDEEIDIINNKSEEIIALWIKQHPDDVSNALTFFEIIKRLERFGDQLKNMSHEIIFHIEAKVLKHHKKQIKIAKDALRDGTV